MGLAVSRALSRKGWKVAVADMNSQSGESAAKEVDGLFVKTDVTDYDNQAAAFAKTWDTYGRIDFGESARNLNTETVRLMECACSIRQCRHRGHLPLLHGASQAPASQTAAASARRMFNRRHLLCVSSYALHAAERFKRREYSDDQFRFDPSPSSLP